jgi:peptidoglycan glycosyltransferase
MMDTRDVRGAAFIGIAFSLTMAVCALAQETTGWAGAVARGARLAPEARIVLLDESSGRVLAASHLAEAARTLAAPGSTLKPLVLYGLLGSARWDPARRVACTRKLTIAGRKLNCSHPPIDSMNAREALTWSCNSYFAAVGATLRPGDLRSLLAPTGLLGQTGLAAGEATAAMRELKSADEERLAVLGVDGILLTPLELAAAYRWLGLQFAANGDSTAVQVVRAGMEDSARFGMAGAAGLGGVPVAGKTGTASASGGGQTHGWFAGLAPADTPRVIIVVYLPTGHGADAARVAAEVLAHSPLRKP